MTFTEEDRYKYSVLEIAQKINGGCRGGTADPLSDTELQELDGWLKWRVHEGWTPTYSRRSEIVCWDDAVWKLAYAALDISRNELERRAKQREREKQNGM